MPDNVTLVRDYDPSLPEMAHDPDQIEQVLLNITRNALQALGEAGGTITLRTRTAFQITLHGTPLPPGGAHRRRRRRPWRTGAAAGHAVLPDGQRP